MILIIFDKKLMFQNLLEKNTEINFFDFSNCHAFEIPNFLMTTNITN